MSYLLFFPEGDDAPVGVIEVCGHFIPNHALRTRARDIGLYVGVLEGDVEEPPAILLATGDAIMHRLTSAMCN